jgi:hypothetical protein
LPHESEVTLDRSDIEGKSLTSHKSQRALTGAKLSDLTDLLVGSMIFTIYLILKIQIIWTWIEDIPEIDFSIS